MWRAAHAQHRVLGLCSVLVLSFAAGQNHPAKAYPHDLAKMAPNAHCYEHGVTATLWPHGTAGPAKDVNIDNFEFGFEQAGQQAQVPLELLIPGTAVQMSSFLRISNPGDYKFYMTSSDPAYLQLTPVTGGPLEPTNVASTYQDNLNTTTSEYSLEKPGLYNMRVFFFKSEPAQPQIRVQWEYSDSISAEPTASKRHIQRGSIWRQQLYRHNCPKSLLARAFKKYPHGFNGAKHMPMPVPSSNANPIPMSHASPEDPSLPTVKELPMPGSVLFPPLGGQEYMPMPMFPSAPGASGGSYGNPPTEGGSYGLGEPGVVGLPATSPGGYGDVGLMSPPPLAYFSPDDVVLGFPTGSYGFTGGYGGQQSPVPLTNNAVQPLFGKSKLPPFEPHRVDMPVASSNPAAAVVPPGHGAVTGGATSVTPVQNALPGAAIKKSKFADPVPAAPITGLSSLDVPTLAQALQAPVAFGMGNGVSATVSPSIPQVVNTITPTVLPAAQSPSSQLPMPGSIQGSIPMVLPYGKHAMPGALKSKFVNPLPDAPITGLLSLDVSTLTQAMQAPVAFGMGNGVSATVSPSIPQVVNTITPTVLPAAQSPLSLLPMPGTVQGSIPMVLPYGKHRMPEDGAKKTKFVTPLPSAPITGLSSLDVPTLTQALQAPVAFGMGSGVSATVSPSIPQVVNTITPTVLPALQTPMSQLPIPGTIPGSLPMGQPHGHWVGGGDEPHWVEDTVVLVSPAPGGLLSNLPNPVPNPLASPAPGGLLSNLPDPVPNPLASPAPGGLLSNLPDPVPNPLASPSPQGLLSNLPNPIPYPLGPGGRWVGRGDEPHWVPGTNMNKLVGSLPMITTHWQGPDMPAPATGPGALTMSPNPINTIPGTVPVVPQQVAATPTVLPASNVFDPVAQQNVQDGVSASWTIAPVVVQTPTDAAFDPLAQPVAPTEVTATWTIAPVVIGGASAPAPDASQMTAEPIVTPAALPPSWTSMIEPASLAKRFGVTPVSELALALTVTKGGVGLGSSVSALPPQAQPLPVVEPVVVAALPDPAPLIPSMMPGGEPIIPTPVIGVDPAALVPAAETLPITQPVVPAVPDLSSAVPAVGPVVTVPDLSSSTPAVEPVVPAVPDLGASAPAVEPVVPAVPDLGASTPAVEPVVPAVPDLSSSMPALGPVVVTVPDLSSSTPAVEPVVPAVPDLSSAVPAVEPVVVTVPDLGASTPAVEPVVVTVPDLISSVPAVEPVVPAVPDLGASAPAVEPVVVTVPDLGASTPAVEPVVPAIPDLGASAPAVEPVVIVTVPDLGASTPAVEPVVPALPDLGASTPAAEPVIPTVPDLGASTPAVEPVMPVMPDLSAFVPPVEPVTPTDPLIVGVLKVPNIARLTPAAQPMLGKKPAASSDLPLGVTGTIPSSLTAALANAAAVPLPDNHELLSAASGVLGFTATNTMGLTPAVPNPTLITSPIPPTAVGAVPAASEPDDHQLESAASGVLGHPAITIMGSEPAASSTAQDSSPVPAQDLPIVQSQINRSVASSTAQDSLPVPAQDLPAVQSQINRSVGSSTAQDSSSVPAQDLPVVQSQINRSVIGKPWLSEQDAKPFVSASAMTPALAMAIGPKLPSQTMGAAFAKALTQAAQTLPAGVQPSAGAVAAGGRLGPVAVVGAAGQAATGGTELNPASNPGQEAEEPGSPQAQPHYFNIAPEQYQPINRRLLEKGEKGAQNTDPTYVSNFITSEQLPGSDEGALRTRVTLISVMEHNGAQRTPSEILSTLAQQEASTTVTTTGGDIAAQASGSQVSEPAGDTQPPQSTVQAYRPWSIISHINGALGCGESWTALHSCVSDVVKRWLPKKSVAPAQRVFPQDDADAALNQYNEEQIFKSLFNDPSVLEHGRGWAGARESTHGDVLSKSHAADLAMHTVAGDHASRGLTSPSTEQD